jgi:hypothetical protein
MYLATKGEVKGYIHDLSSGDMMNLALLQSHLFHVSSNPNLWQNLEFYSILQFTLLNAYESRTDLYSVAFLVFKSSSALSISFSAFSQTGSYSVYPSSQFIKKNILVSFLAVSFS